MTTKLEIWNAALIRCGAEPVATLLEDNKRSVLLRNQYDITLREILNDTTWNFATGRIAIQKGTAPLFGYSASYDIPDTVIRILELYQCGEYRIEGTTLVTNSTADELQIKCILFEEDPAKYTASFVKAFVLKLAEDISYSLVQSATLQQSIISEAERYLRRARSYNSQEGTPADRYPASYTAGLRE